MTVGCDSVRWAATAKRRVMMISMTARTKEREIDEKQIRERQRGTGHFIIASHSSHLLQTIFNEFSRIYRVYQQCTAISDNWRWPARQRDSFPRRIATEIVCMSWQKRCYVASLRVRRGIWRRFSQLIVIFTDILVISGIGVALGNGILIEI